MQANNIIAQVLERMLPVGSIVEWSPVEGGKADLSSADKVAAYYGFGTWEAYGQGRMLLGVNSSHDVGSTGGEETHTLSMSELPKYIIFETSEKFTAGNSPVLANASTWNSAIPTSNYSLPTEGNSTPFSILSPYITVYRWRRIA